MKKVILLALLMPFTAFGQIVENFEQGNAFNWVLSSSGRWKADTTSAISGRYSLHHVFDNPDAGTDEAGLSIKSLHPAEGSTRWSFLIKHGYDPSSLNNWSVFLLSDADPSVMSAEVGTKGFAVGVNLTGSDDTLRLWKVKGNNLETILSSRINWQTEIGISQAIKIDVERTPGGEWTMSVYRLNGTLIRTASAADKELFNIVWFGIYYKYSSTRDRLLWIDNISIEGVFYEDNVAPVVTECAASGRNSVDITLSEEPDPQLMIPDNFKLNSTAEIPVSVLKTGVLTYRLVFADPLINKSENILSVNKICDRSGNCTGIIQVSFSVVWAEPGDVIITEIMADPLPEVSLPGKEYLEIFNRTDYSFNLKNWRFSSELQNAPFPETIIPPMGFIIICSNQDTSLFNSSGKVLGLKQYPSLTDAGKIICLSDSSGNLIHGVEYSSEWYTEELKAGGGWSLEMIDTKFPFHYEGNWTASASRKGGSPGSSNSVAKSNPDNVFYGIVNAFPDDSSNVFLRFSEPLLNLQANVHNITIAGKSIKAIRPADLLFREFLISLAEPLSKGKLYKLEVSGGAEDFAGNRIQETEYTFGLPEQSGSGDIQFNELMFNPLPGDPDYIEFYNNSAKIIDVSRLQLVSVSDASGDTSQQTLVSEMKRCLLPDTYFAITTDRKRVLERYFSANSGCITEVGSLPSMPDEGGHLILYNRELDIIDEVKYNVKMHFSLLACNAGVALEKTGSGFNSMVLSNWHSASESSGWGTPGARNSVFVELPATSDNLVFSSTKISPDNDGFEDLLVIGFNLQGNGNVVSVTVFDETGNLVRKLAENLLAGPEASIAWDGTASDGKLVGTGIYIFLITLYNDTGKTEKWKKVCTVIR